MAGKIDRKAYQRTLPQKRISAGVLLFDEAGRLLIVNPTYKGGWEIPGGAVEVNESPLNGCTREIREELGIDWRPLRLLSVDFAGETAQRTESLNFIFYGGVIPAERIAAIQLPEEELSEYRLMEPVEAVAMLKRRLRRRIERCLPLIASGETLYLEEEEAIWPIEPA